MAIYLCRWPHGDVSLVSATNKREAIIILDEIGNADGAKLWRLDGFLVHLALNDDGDLELAQVGEETYVDVMEKAYPHLWDTQGAVLDAEERGTPGADRIREAVEFERERLASQRRKAGSKDARTGIGRRLQEDHDMSSALADALVDRFAEEALKKAKPKGSGH